MHQEAGAPPPEPFPVVAGYIRRLARAHAPGDHGLTDAELLDRFVAARDEAAFEVLVWRHGGMVLGTCRRVLGREADAEDAFQATFLALVRKAATVRRRGALAGWLYRVAYRVALATRKRAVRHEPLPAAVPDPRPAPAADRADLGRVLAEEVSRLPDRLRAAFVLCCLEGRTVDEAAAELGSPRGTVGCWVSRARERLRGRLTRRGAAPAALVAAALDRAGAAAALPATALVRKTSHAAALAAAGTALPPGLIAPHVPALAHGALAAMSPTHLPIAVAAVAAALLAAAGLAQRPADAAPVPVAAGVAARPDPAGPKSVELTVEVRGVVTDRDVEAVRVALKAVPGVKAAAGAVAPGEKGAFGHYFSPPFVVELADPARADLGAAAKAVAAARTPSRGAVPPGLYVVLFAGGGRVGESDIPAVREAVGDLSGVAARAPGGTVGNTADGTIRVRLDDSGNATPADIRAALRKADLDFRTERP